MQNRSDSGIPKKHGFSTLLPIRPLTGNETRGSLAKQSDCFCMAKIKASRKGEIMAA